MFKYLLLLARKYIQSLNQATAVAVQNAVEHFFMKPSVSMRIHNET